MFFPYIFNLYVDIYLFTYLDPAALAKFLRDLMVSELSQLYDTTWTGILSLIARIFSIISSLHDSIAVPSVKR